MNKLKKCKTCGIYTLKNKCGKCKNQTKSAHYKFIQNKISK